MEPARPTTEETAELVQLLARVPFLSELGPDHLEKLVPHLRLVAFDPGAVIFAEGTIGDTMYVVRRGKVRIYKSTNYDEERTLAERGPGQYFGEMALIDDLPRSAGIAALEPTELVEISKDSFRYMIEQVPGVGYAMMRSLSRQLREADIFFIRDLQTQHQALKEAYQELKEAQDQLKEKARMEQELRIAHDIQMSLLPREDPDLSGYDIRGVSRPAYHVGGDFYCYAGFPDESLGIIVGDVSGKSLPGAIFMAVAQATVASESLNKKQPASVLASAHKQLVGKMAEHRMFVATSLALVHGPTRTAVFANAGQIQPLLCRAEGGECEFVDVCGFPLGMIDYGLFAERGYNEIGVELEPGDLVVFTSDGVSESMNPKRQIYGLDRLSDVVAANRRAPAGELIDVLLADVDAFSEGVPQLDDITIVVLKVAGKS